MDGSGFINHLVSKFLGICFYVMNRTLLIHVNLVMHSEANKNSCRGYSLDGNSCGLYQFGCARCVTRG